MSLYSIPNLIDLQPGANFSFYGVEVDAAFLPPMSQFAHMEYLIPLLADANDGPMSIFGAMTQLNGPTFLPYPIIPPVIQWRNHPAVPPPFQFTTEDGSIQGVIDGRNRVFQTSVLLSRMQVFVNGILQTLDVDCAAPFGQYIVFFANSVPQSGDRITISGWSNL